jgi:polysaccharide biosynthesis transport protein
MSRNFELIRLLQQDGKRQSHPLAVPKISAQILPSRVPEKPRVPQERQSPDWIRAIFILRKHWRLSALFAICVFCGTAIATLVTKPVYEPSVTLEIDPPGTQAFTLERESMESQDAAYLETQAKMLQSSELALDVIRKLRLDQDPDFVGSAKPKRRTASVGQANEAILQLTPRENAALAEFQTRLKVQRDTASRLITLSFASHNPYTAARVANDLISEFNDKSFKTLHEAIMQTSAWLSHQLDDIRAELDQSTKALVEFQERTGIADLDASKSTTAEQISSLDQQLAAARSDRIQLEAQLGRAKDGSPESLPQSGANLLIQTLLQKLADARTELSKEQVQYGKNHPNVKKLQSEVDQLQKELDSQKQRVLEQTQTSYLAAQSRERLFEGELKLTTKQLNDVAEFNALKKKQQTDQDLYNTLYARVKEAGIAAASNANNVRIVDHAEVLQHPTKPQVGLNLAFGLLAAVVGGVMLAFIREAVETRIHTPEDILTATGMPSVSVLPMISGDDAKDLSVGTGMAARLKGGRNGDDTVSRFLLDNPSSAEAEALRGMYATIMLSKAGGRPPQVLLVVSGCSGEGKTTIATNFAIALSRRGPTCLVDGDLRKGSVSRTFGVHVSTGLATVLSGLAELEDVITKVPDVPNLSIVPAGTADRNPGELMGGESMDRVVSDLREQFEFVVFDSPPILPYADGRLLSTLVDGLILVGRHGKTTRSAMAKSIEVLSAIHAAPILEVVLNGGSSVSPGYYGQYGTYSY